MADTARIWAAAVKIDHHWCCDRKGPWPPVSHPLDKHATSLGSGCKASFAARTQGDADQAWLASIHALQRAIASAELPRRRIRSSWVGPHATRKPPPGIGAISPPNILLTNAASRSGTGEAR